MRLFTLIAVSILAMPLGAQSRSSLAYFPMPAIATLPSGLSGQQVVGDDFSTYSDQAALYRAFDTATRGGTAAPGTALYNDGWISNLVSLDKTTLYHGHATMKYTQPGSTGATPEVYVYFPNHRTLNSMWFRAKVKFSPGYITTGTLTNSASAYKLFGWGWKDYNGRGEVAITNTDEYQMGWGSTNNGITLAGASEVGAGRITDEWKANQWYDYIMQWEVTSSTTAVSRVWISKEGESPVLRGVAVGTTVNGGSLPVVNRVALGENFNQMRAIGQDQAVWYGQWEVIDGEQFRNPYNLSF